MTSEQPTTSAMYPNPRYFKTPGKYIAQGTLYTTDMSKMPVDPKTPQYIAALKQMAVKYGNTLGGYIAYEDYARNIPIWVADSRVPGCGTVKMTQTSNMKIAPTNTGDIPAPPFVSAAWGLDEEMSLVDLAKGLIHMYYDVNTDPSVTNGVGFTASQGGYSQNNPDLKNLKDTNFGMRLAMPGGAIDGANVVCTHTEFAQPGFEELIAGVIGHMVTWMSANSAPGSCWPAEQGDGYWTDSPAPLEGQMFRIDPSVNLEDIGLGQWALIIAKAHQRNGGYSMDRNAAKTSIIFDSPFYDLHFGLDPWKAVWEAFGNDFLDLSDYPIDLLQYAPAGWIPKKEDQTAPPVVPTKYKASDWTINWQKGSFPATTTSHVAPLAIACTDTPKAPNSGNVSFTRKFNLTKATTFTAPTHSRKQQPDNFYASSIEVFVDNKLQTSTTSRATKGRQLKFTIPAGVHTLKFQFNMRDQDCDPQWIGPMTPVN